MPALDQRQSWGKMKENPIHIQVRFYIFLKLIMNHIAKKLLIQFKWKDAIFLELDVLDAIIYYCTDGFFKAVFFSGDNKDLKNEIVNIMKK